LIDSIFYLIGFGVVVFALWVLIASGALDGPTLGIGMAGWIAISESLLPRFGRWVNAGHRDIVDPNPLPRFSKPDQVRRRTPSPQTNPRSDVLDVAFFVFGILPTYAFCIHLTDATSFAATLVGSLVWLGFFEVTVFSVAKGIAGLFDPAEANIAASALFGHWVLLAATSQHWFPVILS
jgi:hypothetical protein